MMKLECMKFSNLLRLISELLFALAKPQITSRMLIAALRASHAPRRCGAPLRYIAPRPLRPRGLVTRAIYPMLDILRLQHNLG